MANHRKGEENKASFESVHRFECMPGRTLEASEDMAGRLHLYTGGIGGTVVLSFLNLPILL